MRRSRFARRATIAAITIAASAVSIPVVVAVASTSLVGGLATGALWLGVTIAGLAPAVDEDDRP